MEHSDKKFIQDKRDGYSGFVKLTTICTVACVLTGLLVIQIIT